MKTTECVQVVVNPYKRYPIYTHRVCKIYLGKRRNEANLHFFSGPFWVLDETNFITVIMIVTGPPSPLGYC